MNYNRRYQDPYRTEARFNSNCATCKKPIKKGEKIVYCPNDREAHHEECGSGIMRGLQSERSMDQYGTDIY